MFVFGQVVLKAGFEDGVEALVKILGSRGKGTHIPQNFKPGFHRGARLIGLLHQPGEFAKEDGNLVAVGFVRGVFPQPIPVDELLGLVLRAEIHEADHVDGPKTVVLLPLLELPMRQGSPIVEHPVLELLAVGALHLADEGGAVLAVADDIHDHLLVIALEDVHLVGVVGDVHDLLRQDVVQQQEEVLLIVAEDMLEGPVA